MEKNERSTKKQHELLSYIDAFIKSNGYGPSYREVMRALDYKSVSTVAVHVNGLIARGYLRKKDNSARSIEVVSLTAPASNDSSEHEAWLLERMKAALITSPVHHQLFLDTLEALGIEPTPLSEP